MNSQVWGLIAYSMLNAFINWVESHGRFRGGAHGATQLPHQSPFLPNPTPNPPPPTHTHKQAHTSSTNTTFRRKKHCRKRLHDNRCLFLATPPFCFPTSCIGSIPLLTPPPSFLSKCLNQSLKPKVSLRQSVNVLIRGRKGIECWRVLFLDSGLSVGAFYL